jgi:AcrR family transcriptional regulator
MRERAMTQSDTKKRIITVASELFYSYGYEKTTLRMIAQQIGISHVSILSHFNNKSEIGNEVFLKYINGLIRICQELKDKLPPEYSQEGYHFQVLWWSLHFTLLSENPAFRRFFISHYRNGPIIFVQSPPRKPDVEMINLVPEHPLRDDLIATSLIVAIDVNLVSLIDLNVIDSALAADLIIRQAGAIDFIPKYQPDEAEIRQFISTYLSDLKINLLHDILLV